MNRNMDRKIGVYICHCGSNIAGTVDVDAVTEFAQGLPSVVTARNYTYMCSDPGQDLIREDIKNLGINRVVVASCSPLMHERTFRQVCESAGLNRYQFQMANIREHCSWVSEDHGAATEKAKALVSAAISRVYYNEPLETREVPINPNTLVVGGGIAGIQAALEIADSRHKVYLVEREPSIGGHMIQLDKTFPTLDCSACILTPKMSLVGSHPYIELMSYSEVVEVSGYVGNFKVKVKKKPRYVDVDKCTGCGECEKVCPVEAPSEFEYKLANRRAIYRPFPQAVPNVFAIDKRGYPPCRAACPAGVNAQGYIALISQGKFKEALDVLRRTMPFAGVCGRVCTHPCERDCERGKVDQPIAIRSLKRFMADYELKAGREKATPVKRTKEEKVAVIGSGPAGIACAYDLVRQGYPVTVFEAAPKAGGLLRYGIPEYRLPNEIVDNEISYVQELGVEIKTNTLVKNLSEVFNQGYKAIFLATGAGVSQKMNIPGEDTLGVIHALDFLEQISSGAKASLGNKVAVIGGGNAAVDAARVAMRLGVKEVTIVYRRSRAEMPAIPSEIEEMEHEGVKIHFLAAPVKVLSKDNRVTGIQCIRMELGEPDASGRRRPMPIKGSEFDIDVDNVIIAIGQMVNKEMLPKELAFTGWGTLVVDPITLQTNIDGVFAGGDVVSGPADVIAAIATGKEVAVSIDRYLCSVDLKEGRPEARESVKDVPKEGVVTKERAVMPVLELGKRAGSFAEVELGFDETKAVAEAKRCLNCAVCSECQECEKVCEAKAIDHEMQDEVVEEDVGAIVVATGVKVLDHTQFSIYGGGVYPDVISSLQLERMMSAAGPTGGEVICPSNGVHPKDIVFVSCVGSRDERTGNGYCSKVCCMYMAKHAVMLKEHYPETHSYIVYTDARGPGGKIFEEFLTRAQEAGTTYLRGRIDKVSQCDGRLSVSGQDLLKNKTFNIPGDLVVLATGLMPSDGVSKLAQSLNISYDTKNYLLQAHVKLRPVETFTDGIFLAGCAIAPTDIPESVAQGGAAAEYVLKLFSHDVIDAEPMTSIVDISRCSGCLLCRQVCPFTAIEAETLKDGRVVASINESLCKGCGVCVAACRPGAIKLRGFSDQQLLAEVMAL
ncbi:MAG TPA: FAD-dependent oxidoreductase [Dehalococcoidia bacterium]|nr:FAD-dependent oxidoreductase [Dehalococcoidia bacterium]